jgi:hypothetical protein
MWPLTGSMASYGKTEQTRSVCLARYRRDGAGDLIVAGGEVRRVQDKRRSDQCLNGGRSKSVSFERQSLCVAIAI